MWVVSHGCFHFCLLCIGLYIFRDIFVSNCCKMTCNFVTYAKIPIVYPGSVEVYPRWNTCVINLRYCEIYCINSMSNISLTVHSWQVITWNMFPNMLYFLKLLIIFNSYNIIFSTFLIVNGPKIPGMAE